MSWIRLDDDYINHPKFTRLSHLAFRLWHEGIAYCRKAVTDGFIGLEAVAGFRYATPEAVVELLSSPKGSAAAPLWKTVEDGYEVHDFKDWNPTRREEVRDRKSAKKRMRAFRGRESISVTADVTPAVTRTVTAAVTPSVPGQGQGTDLGIQEREPERKPTARSGRVVFRGQRFVVFEWQFEDFLGILGIHADAFDLHQWFSDLDAACIRNGLVAPKRDGGEWLQSQLIAESQRRGIDIQVAKSQKEAGGKLTNRMADLVRTAEAER